MCRARQEASSPDAASRSAPNSRSVSSIRYCSPSRSTTDLSTSPISALTTSGRSSDDLGAHFLGGVQAEPPGEHRQPRPQPPLGGRAQLVRPLDRRAQRLVPGQRPRPAAGQHARTGGRAARRARRAAACAAGTAASSIASGMPSSRRHSRMTSATFSAVIVKSGTAAAARSANSSTASPPPPGRPGQARASRPPAPAAARPGRCARPACRAAAVRWRARSRRARPRSTAWASAAQASSRCSQVSRISSSSPLPQVLEQRVKRGPGVLLGQAEHARDRVGQQRGIAQAGQLDDPRAVRVAGRRLRGRGERHPGLADPARPDDRHQAGLARAARRAARARPACRRSRCTRPVESVRPLNNSPPTSTRSVRAWSGPGDPSCLDISLSATSRHRESQVHGRLGRTTHTWRTVARVLPLTRYKCCRATLACRTWRAAAPRH